MTKLHHYYLLPFHRLSLFLHYFFLIAVLWGTANHWLLSLSQPFLFSLRCHLFYMSKSKTGIHVREEWPGQVASIFRGSIIQYNTESGVHNVITAGCMAFWGTMGNGVKSSLKIAVFIIRLYWVLVFTFAWFRLAAQMMWGFYFTGTL